MLGGAVAGGLSGEFAVPDSVYRATFADQDQGGNNQFEVGFTAI